MNCKPGDLAMIVSGPASYAHMYIGTVLTVKRSYVNAEGVPCWYVDRRLPDHPVWGQVRGVYDSCLQPIRPPRADAPIDTRVNTPDTCTP